MEQQTIHLEWKKNPVYIAGIITAIILFIVSLLFYLDVDQNLRNAGFIVLLISLSITYLFYDNQCPKCKSVFKLKKVSDEVIKKWEEPKQYNVKTIYYYSDGITQKKTTYGPVKTFIARFERHKKGYNCMKCSETHYKIENVFTNKSDWLRATTSNEVTTSTRKPIEHYSNMNFDLGSFEPTYYNDKSKRRKTIPKRIKMELWKKYNGKKYNGKCYVCKTSVDTHHFEAGHVVPASKGGSDKISNLRPICTDCNRGMSNMDLNEYKRRYH